MCRRPRRPGPCSSFTPMPGCFLTPGDTTPQLFFHRHPPPPSQRRPRSRSFLCILFFIRRQRPAGPHCGCPGFLRGREREGRRARSGARRGHALLLAGWGSRGPSLGICGWPPAEVVPLQSEGGAGLNNVWVICRQGQNSGRDARNRTSTEKTYKHPPARDLSDGLTK